MINDGAMDNYLTGMISLQSRFNVVQCTNI